MESEVFTPSLEQFMLTPLVCWVKTVGQATLTDGTQLSEYIELVDGIYLNEIMLEMASYSRHSWDSCWTRGKREAELLLGCQSVRFSYCSYLDCG
ncbi:Girdin, partial [Dissostichus eleginoides]